MPTVASANDMPLRTGPPVDFSRSLEFFQEAAFDEATVCKTLSLSSISDFRTVQWEKLSPDAGPARLWWCVRTFMRGLVANEQESRAICGDDSINSFISLGLLRSSKRDPNALVCPVWLYPCEGFVVASDRTDDPDGDPAFEPGQDVVFPAIYQGTLRFLELLPDSQVGAALDLCGGSGIGALRLSRTAQTVTTADVAERSAMFADFNGRLNGVRMESVCGDVYEPVSRRHFDLISAHPPFVPAMGPHMVYRDGGETGEEITRRIIAGLPEYLRPGGTGVILCVARDTEERSFEHRARDWLGDQGDQFDIIFGCEKILSVPEIAESLCKGRRGINGLNVRTVTERLLSLQTRRFVYGALFLRRLNSRVGQEPLRLQLTLQGRPADFERVLFWRQKARQPEFIGQLASSRPRLAKNLELTVRHCVEGGELVPAECTFSVAAGFQAALRPDGWAVPLIARLNGGISVADVYEQARLADELPQGFPVESLLDLVGRMIERGFLEIPA